MDKLAKARAVMEDGEATEKDVTNSEKELSKAIDGLIIADAGNNNGGNNNGGNSNDGGSNNSGNSNNNGNSNNGGNNGNSNLPKTGGTPAAAVGLFGTVMATIGAVMFKKKK